MNLQEAWIGAFAAELGDLERKPDDLPGFGALWQAVSSGADFPTMGCGTFRRMSGPVKRYVAETVTRTLSEGGRAAKDIDRIVFATTDGCLQTIGRDFIVEILQALGLVRCVPVLLSFQQCCSSVSALSYAWNLFSDPEVRNAVVVAFDSTANDADRVRPFALFGDGVTSCLVSRDGDSGLRLVSSAVRVDFDGLLGRDSIRSRQEAAQEALSTVLAAGATSLDEVAMVFPTNLFMPLTLFNTAVVGVRKTKLHFTETLRHFGHCGNCDWMLNLMSYRDAVGLHPGERYLLQASAPGFIAWGLLVAV